MCKAMTKAGRPCEAPELPGRGWCYHHDPERAQERQAARRRGGISRQFGPDGRPEPVQMSIEGVRDVIRLLEQAASDALSHPPSLQRSRALVHVGLAALKALEVGALEERLDALEQGFTTREAI